MIESESDDDAVLIEVLTEARHRGFLGPGPIEDHIALSERFLKAVDKPGYCLDLGSGGGVPGLVLATRISGSEWLLVDAMAQRARFLNEALEALQIRDRCGVIQGRAEELAQSAELRGVFTVVTARSFARPGITAECASGFLRVGGRLIVSEPPEQTDRWDAKALGELQMTIQADLAGLKVIEQTAPCPDKYPRRNGVPAKKPLF